MTFSTKLLGAVLLAAAIPLATASPAQADPWWDQTRICLNANTPLPTLHECSSVDIPPEVGGFFYELGVPFGPCYGIYLGWLQPTVEACVEGVPVLPPIA